MEAALELHRAGARVTLIHRSSDLSDRVKPWVLPDIRNRLKAGDITAYFSSSVRRVDWSSITLATPEGERKLANDFVLMLTGYHPDPSLLAQLGAAIDPETGIPRHDRDTMQTNVPGLYVAGVLAAGYDANTIFIENGREHGARIVASIVRS